MAEHKLIEPDADELMRLIEQARLAEAPPLDGVQQYRLVRAALAKSRAPERLAPRITRYVLGLAAALLMGLLGARAFELTTTRLNLRHVEVAQGEPPARLWLRSGDGLVLAQESALDIVSETPLRRELRLDRGALLCDVRPLTGGELFELVTPHAHMRVRGTVFSVQVDDQHTTVQVHEGKVQVAGRMLRAGEHWSSLTSAPRGDSALFAAEVREALAARAAAQPPSEPAAPLEPKVEPIAPPTVEVLERPAAPAQRDVIAPLPTPVQQLQPQPAPLPPSPEAAELMLHRGQTEELLDLLADHRGEPAYARVYADALRARGDFERATNAYEALSEQSQGNLRDQAAYAAAQLALGPLRDPLRALHIIERCDLTGASSPLRERASVLRIDALVMLGRRDEAREATREYLAREPETETSGRLQRLLEEARP